MQPESDQITGQLQPSLEKLEPFTVQLDSLLSKGVPVVLAIDGRAASEKSSLAEKLARHYHARVIHMDDFFLPIELRTAERLAEPGGNLHYERFKAEVLPVLRQKEGFNYQAFDCAFMQLGAWRSLAPTQFTIVEGSYTLHPKLGPYYDLALFMSCPPEHQLARIKARNPNRLEQFQNKWIPLEEAFFLAYGIEQTADLKIQT